MTPNGNAELLAQLRRVSDFLPRLLTKRPGLADWILRSRTLEREKPLEVYVRQGLGAVRHLAADDTEGLYRRLRRFKYRELLRIAVRDAIVKAPMDELGREATHLADATVRAALHGVSRPLHERYGEPTEGGGFCVLGLGKMGGGDLNFSSDIDLIYFYRQDGETKTGTETVKLYTRVAQELTKALSTTTADGFGYRVDLNLRPQGRAGSLVMSLGQMLTYYEQFGRTWERSALIKARPVAGDLELGNELLDSLSPFVWRRSTDLSAVDDLRDMRSQIDLRGKASGDDVKLGRGGIREVEFFVSALQLLHGGKQDHLRERTTMKALRKLEKAGLVATTDADQLEEAYSFLRRTENHLQMVDERQTQTLPMGDEERTRLAVGLGLESWAELSSRLS
ncbi:MAG: putative nucleotidyltransferase substrate binding domain-containing protein, partial [Myxococcaceae bacterium]